MNPNNPNPPTGFLRATSKPAEDPQESHMATDTPRNVSLVVDPSTQNTRSDTAPKPPAGALFVDRRQTSSNGYRFRTVLGVERGIEGHDVTSKPLAPKSPTAVLTAAWFGRFGRQPSPATAPEATAPASPPIRHANWLMCCTTGPTSWTGGAGDERH
jgi:hypothetical protein